MSIDLLFEPIVRFLREHDGGISDTEGKVSQIVANALQESPFSVGMALAQMEQQGYVLRDYNPTRRKVFGVLLMEENLPEELQQPQPTKVEEPNSDRSRRGRVQQAVFAYFMEHPNETISAETIAEATGLSYRQVLQACWYLRSRKGVKIEQPIQAWYRYPVETEPETPDDELDELDDEATSGAALNGVEPMTLDFGAADDAEEETGNTLTLDFSGGREEDVAPGPDAQEVARAILNEVARILSTPPQTVPVGTPDEELLNRIGLLNEENAQLRSERSSLTESLAESRARISELRKRLEGLQHNYDVLERAKKGEVDHEVHRAISSFMDRR